MRIIIDAFGGDNAPDEIIKGCRLAADELHVQIVLTGDEKKIRAAAEKLNVNVSDFEIIDCPDVITMEDEPTAITRAKKQSSMAVGLRALAEGKGDAFASAGNSGHSSLAPHCSSSASKASSAWHLHRSCRNPRAFSCWQTAAQTTNAAPKCWSSSA